MAASRRPLHLVLAVGALAALLTACSGFHPYQSRAAENLTLRSQVMGTFWRKAAGRVHIFSLSGACDARYVGTIELDQNEIRAGVPTGQRTYLQFVFETAPRWGQGGSSVSTPVVFVSKPGASYEAHAKYVDARYAVTFRENDKELDPDLGACSSNLQP